MLYSPRSCGSIPSCAYDPAPTSVQFPDQFHEDRACSLHYGGWRYHRNHRWLACRQTAKVVGYMKPHILGHGCCISKRFVLPILFLAMGVGVVVDIAVRIESRASVSKEALSIMDALSRTIGTGLAPLPIVIAAIVSARTARVHGAWSALVVAPLSLASHAYCTY